MVLLESIDIEHGRQFPTFKLKNPAGEWRSSSDMIGSKGLFVAFTCNHCPYAIALWSRLINAAQMCRKMGFEMLAINPNINPDYPSDSPENMAALIKKMQIPFEYLIDEDQSVARQFDAQCTPDFYVLDSNMALIYHGRFDDNWKAAEAVSETSLLDAIQRYSESGQYVDHMHPSMGCSIKWIR